MRQRFNLSERALWLATAFLLAFSLFCASAQQPPAASRPAVDDLSWGFAPPAPQKSSLAAVPLNYQGWNQFWDLVAIAQGPDVAPGSPLALQWDTPPYSGTTGGHPPYGYRHKHKLQPLSPDARQQAIRAILAGSCARHCAYTGPAALVRSGGYDRAMRPLSWAGPELANDTPGGGALWMFDGKPVVYTGKDEQHDWSMLDDVALHYAGTVVPFLPGIPGEDTRDAAVVAHTRIIVEAAGLAGIARQPYYLEFHPEVGGSSDRGFAIMVGELVRAYSLAALPDGEDQAAALAIIKATSNFYNRAPGVGLNDKTVTAQPPIPQGAVYFCPTHAAMSAAARYDAAVAIGLGDPPLAAKLREECKRLGRWAADSLFPDGRMPWVVTLSPEALAGNGGAPWPTLAPLLRPGDRRDAGFDAAAWAYRGIQAAGALGDPVCASAAARILQAWAGDQASWSWLVTADWKYAAPGARAAAGE